MLLEKYSGGQGGRRSSTLWGHLTALDIAPKRVRLRAGVARQSLALVASSYMLTPSTSDWSKVPQDRWALAFARASGPPGADPGRGPDPIQVETPTWLEAPAGRFFADPFLHSHCGEMWVFFEDYHAISGRGHIAASPLLNFQPRPVLVRDWHLSYPFLLEDEGELYCVPEQHEAGDVSLYRCLEFPHRWVKEAVLLADFQGVDPTLIRHEGRYWMWVGEQRRRARDQTFLFHAPALQGPWVEHSLSPAICRPDLARPAGQPWMDGGQWHRPAQDRRGTYGGGMVIYRVDRLNPYEYEESEVMIWRPRPSWLAYQDGLHHVCHLGAWTVWDAKRFVEIL